MKLTIIVLAAGFSKRFEANKLLFPMDGRCMVEHILTTLSKLSYEVVVVTQYEEVIALCQSYPFKSVLHTTSKKGISSSIHVGVLHSMESDGWLFVHGDQPYLTSESLTKMLKTASTDNIVCACLSGNRRHPVYFGSTFREELLALQGDVGGRVILKRHESSIRYEEFPAQELIDIDYNPTKT